MDRINPRTGEAYKSPTALALNHNMPYQAYEDEQVREFKGNDKIIAKALGRSIDSVQCRRKRMRKNAGKPPLMKRFTPAEDKLIIEGGRTDRELGVLLNRHRDSIRGRRRCLKQKENGNGRHSNKASQGVTNGIGQS